MVSTDTLKIILNLHTAEVLETIQRKVRITFRDLDMIFGETVPDLKKIIEHLLDLQILKEDQEKKILLTTRGLQKLILLQVICEKKPLDSLSQITSEQIATSFQLIVTNDLSSKLFKEIQDSSDESEIDGIDICSPWIILTDLQKEEILRLKDKGAVIYFITRPPDDAHPNVISTHNFLKNNNFSLKYYKQKLHTKLYLIKRKDYKNIAIFGSENLTNMRMTELGIRIRDERFFYELQDYFENLLIQSTSPL